MGDTTQDVKKPFEINARTVTSGQGDALEVDVKNASGAASDGFLLIEFKLPAELSAPLVRKAALDARTSLSPHNMTTLANVVTAAEGWSVWAINDPNDNIVVIRFFNSVNQLTGELTETSTPFAAGAVLKLGVPLAAGAAQSMFEMDYGYQTGEDDTTRVDGTLELKPSHLRGWTPPLVSLTCKEQNPTMLKPGSEVHIEWRVENGVAATLRGPLPGGNSQLPLSRERTSNFKIEEGGMMIYAVGPATYVLDAEVKGPGEANVQIIRTLTLDIFSAEKYANVTVHPSRVLPNGQVEIDWTVWGVQKASIMVSDRVGLDLELTEQNLHRTYQGTGTWLVHATQDREEEFVSLKVTSSPKQEALTRASIMAARWRPVKRPVYTGRPVAMAVTDGVIALLTSDGLYTAHVGPDDKIPKEPVFARSAAAGKAWHALSTFGREFIFLRQTDGGDIVLERYDGRGQPVALPVTLPGDFQTIARLPGAVFDLVGYGSRVYAVAEAQGRDKTARVAYSVRPGSDEPARPEGLLSSLPQYRLVTCGGVLYAYQRVSGRMLRFGLKAGELDKPRRAARAVNGDGISMIATGLIVPVGPVLAVLNPAALPTFDPMKTFGLLNVVEFALQRFTPAREQNDIPQDLSYNPQRDNWAACGHGLDIQAGAVAAFRGGPSKRLWVLQPDDGTMHTLALAYEKLFATDYLDGLHIADLPPVLDAAREFTLVNQSGIDLVPLDGACREADLEYLSADGPAELTPAPENFPSGSEKRFTLTYSSTDTTRATLRFMAANPPGVRYLLEMSFSGEGLGRVTTVFKRLGRARQIVDVAGSLKEHQAGADSYTLKEAGALLQRKRLFIANATTHDLRAGSTSVSQTAGIEVAYNTPDLEISVPEIEKVGRLTVNFDLTLPFGIEMSKGSEPQRKMMRVTTDDLNMLNVEVSVMGTLFTSVGGGFELYDKAMVAVGKQTEDVCGLKVGLKTKMELDGVRLGDPVLGGGDRHPLYIPLKSPTNHTEVRVMMVEAGGFGYGWDSLPTESWVFDLPNAVAASDDKVFVMLGEPTLRESSRYMQSPWQETRYDIDYKEVSAIAASPAGDFLMLVRQNIQNNNKQLVTYKVVLRRANGQVRDFPLVNKLETPDNVPPLAVSPVSSPFLAAVGDKGGLLLIDLSNGTTAPVRLGGAQEPAHLAFSPDGKWIYSAHSTRVFEDRPRRAVAGRNVVVSRYIVYGVRQPDTITLPDVESDFSMTASRIRAYSTLRGYKEEVALTLAPSPDGRNLFVSAGKTIMKIDLANFTLTPWRANVELPCRLIFVKEARGNAYTVFALGSYYVGDGTTVEQYKTHLYAIPAPKG
jgi:hypothetical protein